MKIQYASDLHLELAENSRYLKMHPLEVAGDVLLLAGDTIYLGQESLMKHPFWRWAADHFEQVIAVPGNHEYYAYSDIAAQPESFQMELFPNVRICSNTVEHIGDVDIIASTLWAHIDPQDAYYTQRSSIASCMATTCLRRTISTASTSGACNSSSRLSWKAKPRRRLCSPTMCRRDYARPPSLSAVASTVPSPWSWATTLLKAA